MKTKYICTLPQIMQKKIKDELIVFFTKEGFSRDTIQKEVEISMNGRLCDCPVFFKER